MFEYHSDSKFMFLGVPLHISPPTGSWGDCKGKLACSWAASAHTLFPETPWASLQKQRGTERYHTPDDPFGVGGLPPKTSKTQMFVIYCIWEDMVGSKILPRSVGIIRPLELNIFKKSHFRWFVDLETDLQLRIYNFGSWSLSQITGMVESWNLSLITGMVESLN